MIGPLTAVRRLTSTASALASTTVRAGVSTASTAVHGALRLAHRGGTGPAPERDAAPEPTRVPTPPDPAVALVSEPAAEAPAKKAPAKKAPAKKAPAKKASATKSATKSATTKTDGPKPAPPRKKASEVPLKSEPTPASAAPAEPEGPDVLPDEHGATGLTEPEPLLDPGVAAQVRSESEQLRSAAE